MTKQERDAMSGEERNALTLEQLKAIIDARIEAKRKELHAYAEDGYDTFEPEYIHAAVHNVFLALDDLDNVY